MIEINEKIYENEDTCFTLINIDNSENRRYTDGRKSFTLEVKHKDLNDMRELPKIFVVNSSLSCGVKILNNLFGVCPNLLNDNHLLEFMVTLLHQIHSYTDQYKEELQGTFSITATKSPPAFYVYSDTNRITRKVAVLDKIAVESKCDFKTNHNSGNKIKVWIIDPNKVEKMYNDIIKRRKHE